MITIPSGTFIDSNNTTHQIQSFKLSKYPTTVNQWRHFLKTTNYNWPFNLPDQPNLPITNISYHDALAYCNWAGYRLPTGPEWEFACKANGPDPPENIREYAWCYENSGDELHSVGLKKPNQFGIYDMLGNCWEWTEEAVGSSRVLRGGGWHSDAYGQRGSLRFVSAPTVRFVDAGFRCGVSHPRYEVLNSEVSGVLRKKSRINFIIEN